MNRDDGAARRSTFFDQNFRRRSRYQLVFLLLAAALVLITVLNINIGSVPIPMGEILRILLRRATDSTQYSIIWKIRLPRILMAAILGGALSLSGFLLQNFFGNPIAGPFVLGISSGAKLVVAVTMIFFMEKLGRVSSYALIVAAFAGSLMAVGFILLLSRRLKHMAILLVGGIMIGYICSAVTDFIVTFAEESDIVNLRGWSLGSFSGMGWDNVGVAAVMVGVTSAATFMMATMLIATMRSFFVRSSISVYTCTPGIWRRPGSSFVPSSIRWSSARSCMWILFIPSTNSSLAPCLSGVK